LIEFDAARLKTVVSRSLSGLIKAADIRIEKFVEPDLAAAAAALMAVSPDSKLPRFLAFLESDDKKCRIEVQISKDAYLSGAETSSADSQVSSEDFETDKKCANHNIKVRLVEDIFHSEVSADRIEVRWSESSSSFFVLIETTFIAARLLYYLVEIEDETMKQLGIRAMLYEGNCAGCDPMTIQKKLARLPKGSRILQEMRRGPLMAPRDLPSLSAEEFSELAAMYGHLLLRLPARAFLTLVCAGMMMNRETRMG
jgi:hypothetical protein